MERKRNAQNVLTTPAALTCCATTRGHAGIAWRVLWSYLYTVCLKNTKYNNVKKPT
jgi:hypothetical protein